MCQAFRIEQTVLRCPLLSIHHYCWLVLVSDQCCLVLLNADCTMFPFLLSGSWYIYICTYLCYIMSIHIIYTYIIIHLWISYDIYSIHIISHHYILYIFSISPWNICSFFSAAPSRSSRFDPFEILEVSPGASAAEVKKAPTLFLGVSGDGAHGEILGKMMDL